MQLALKPNMSFCVTNDRTVFLDLSADRYFCLPTALESDFQRLVEDQNCSKLAAGVPTELLATGLFTPRIKTSSPLIPAAHLLPTQSCLEQDFMSPKAIEVAWALGSQVLTTLRLRLHNLSKTIDRVAHRKRRAGHNIGGHANNRLARLVHAFLVTRRVIPNQNRCLHRSIALVDFLAWHGIYPTLVIGVRMQPFAAHAWVQIGDTVLNDHLDEVLVHTPILVV